MSTQKTDMKPAYFPSEVSISRKNFSIYATVVIPAAWILSYIFLSIYFKLDKGFFSETNMRFKYDKYKTDGRITGVWEDLNDYVFDCERHQKKK